MQGSQGAMPCRDRVDARVCMYLADLLIDSLRDIYIYPDD